MNQALEDLIGNEVEVRSNTGDDDCVDTGVLEAFDYPWLRIRKGERELLCFPVHNVRLVKLIRRLAPDLPRKPDAVLLRPAGVDSQTDPPTD